jgi:hypothetical protein
MILCPNCRTIQKANSICTICGSRIETPVLLVDLPREAPRKRRHLPLKTGTDL